MAYFSFHDQRHAPLQNGYLLRIYQRLAPHPDYKEKVTTLQASYALILGDDPDTDWFVRYDYEPEEGRNPNYQYPVAHVHINATSQLYDSHVTRYGGETLSSLHFPTGRLAIEDFIEFLIVQWRIPVCQGTSDEAVRFLRTSAETFRSEKQTNW